MGVKILQGLFKWQVSESYKVVLKVKINFKLLNIWSFQRKSEWVVWENNIKSIFCMAVCMAIFYMAPLNGWFL